MSLKAFSRLATVRRHAASILALALGFAAAAALVSCGGEDAKLLPGNTAQEITENLDRVQQYADEGECIGAEDAVAEVSEQVEAVEGIDPELEEVLQQGVARLSQVVGECEETTETVPSTEEEETTTEEAEPPGQEKKEEKEREKEERELEKEEAKQERDEEKAEETTTTEEPPESSEPPAGKDGGTDAPGGVSPSAPVGPEGDQD